jgi:divalent metal cation (Fe/Co/Zn/Cd) transporter
VPDRDELLSAAIRWSVLSVGWALLVGTASLLAGVSSGSTALVGFGLSSLVDGTASLVLVWRFRHELHGERPGHELEHLAARAIGVILVLIGLFVAVRAVTALTHHDGPEPSSLGVVLTASSMLVLPILARAKLRLSGPLQSQALRADGVLSAAGAMLAGAALAGLALDAALDWWWADSVAALAIAGALMREGIVTAPSIERD